MSNHEEYIPGVCNIGKKEIIKRRNSALMAGLLAAVMAVLMVFYHVNHLWRLTVAIPLLSFMVGIQQWYFGFCVAFGMKGIFNFKDLGTATNVEQAEMLRADRRKAQRMILTGLALAVALAVGFFLLPL